MTIYFLTMVAMYSLRYDGTSSNILPKILENNNSSYVTVELIEIFSKEIVFSGDNYQLVCEIFLQTEDYQFNVGDSEYFDRKYGMCVNDYVSSVVPAYGSDSWTFCELNSFYIVDNVRYIIDDGMMRFEYLIEEWSKDSTEQSYIHGSMNMSY